MGQVLNSNIHHSSFGLRDMALCIFQVGRIFHNPWKICYDDK